MSTIFDRLGWNLQRRILEFQPIGFFVEFERVYIFKTLSRYMTPKDFYIDYNSKHIKISTPETYHSLPEEIIVNRSRYTIEFSVCVFLHNLSSLNGYNIRTVTRRVDFGRSYRIIEITGIGSVSQTEEIIERLNGFIIYLYDENDDSITLELENDLIVLYTVYPEDQLRDL